MEESSLPFLKFRNLKIPMFGWIQKGPSCVTSGVINQMQIVVKQRAYTTGATSVRQKAAAVLPSSCFEAVVLRFSSFLIYHREGAIAGLRRDEHFGDMSSQHVWLKIGRAHV